MFEEKKTELHTKVVEIYEASPTEIKVRTQHIHTYIYICNRRNREKEPNHD